MSPCRYLSIVGEESAMGFTYLKVSCDLPRRSGYA
jgi:hypothetical protein